MSNTETDTVGFSKSAIDGILSFFGELKDKVAPNVEENEEEREEGEVTVLDPALSEGDVVWKPDQGYNALRQKVEVALREAYPANSSTSLSGPDSYYSEYWVEDIQNGKALVCAYPDYWVANFTVDGDNVTISPKEEWTPVEKAWVESNLSEAPTVMAELFFDSDTKALEDEEGLIWKTVMREGTWQYSPGPGQTPVPKPITVKKSGTSDLKNFVLSLEELKENFESGAVEHVTVPTSHADKVEENTGFIKALRISKDENGKAILEAAHHFTEPEIKEKVLRGSIANVSAGIKFDYINKESGKKFNSVIQHVALTNHPWLTGMKPFGVNASENIQVISLSEHSVDSNIIKQTRGGEEVSNTAVENTDEVTTTFFDEIGLSQDEIRALVSKNKELEAENKKNRVDAKGKEWQDAGKSPALVTVAKAILMGEVENVSVNLSEDGTTKTISLSEVVERLVAAAPCVDLTDAPVTDEDVAGDKPAADASVENEEAKLSDDEKIEYFSLMFDQKLSSEEALKRVKKDNS